MIGYDSYSVPETVNGPVDLIRVSAHPLHHTLDNPTLPKRSNTTLSKPTLLSRPRAGGSNATVVPSLDNCDQYMTLECLRTLYSIDYTPEVPQLNSFGIGVSFVNFTCFSSPHLVEFTPQAYLGSDLDMFFSYVSFISVFW